MHLAGLTRVAPLLLLALFGLYVLAGKIGLALASVHSSASPVWPAAGIALGAILTLGYRYWPAIFAGAFVVNVTTTGSVASSLGFATGNTLEALLGAYLVNRFANGVRAFERAQDVFKFVAVAGLATLVSSTIDVASLALGGHASWADVGHIGLTLWLGDAVGVLIFAPLLVLWVRPAPRAAIRRHPFEAPILLLSTVLVGLAVFSDSLPLVGHRTFLLRFLCTAPLIWAAFRLGPREAATLMAVLSVIGIGETVRGAGPFASGPADESLLLLQAFMGIVAGLILAAAALVEERRRIEGDREELLAREQAARAEAEGVNRAKDEFLALLGYELRNPLAVIVSAVSVLERLPSHDDFALRARAAIRHQITQLGRLVDELLDVSRVTSGNIVLACQQLNLATSVQRSVSALTGTGRLERHFVHFHAEPVWVNADPARLDQIVSTLVANAAKYTAPGGAISVRVRSEADEAVVSIEDTGIGIPPRLLPQIFDLFAHGAQARDHGQGGPGVGLALVRRLVGLHGGRVEASSNGPGCGSEFVVRLPRVAPPLPAPAAVERELLMRDGAPRIHRNRILIVEDNADAREMLRLALELAGHEVDVAEDGRQALDLVATNKSPEVVLIDIGLPGMDGYEVARRLRATSRGPEMRLLALTGYGHTQDRSLASDLDAYLVKPVDPDELLRTIGKVASAKG